MSNPNKVSKRITNNGKFFLGTTIDNENLYLAPASWDCEWYWGFGYLGNKNLHCHFDSLVGEQSPGKYVHHINEIMKTSVLTEEESWELSDLMTSFYTLRKTADLLYSSGSHKSNKGKREFLKNEEMRKHINEVMLPQLFESVYKILTPTKSK